MRLELERNKHRDTAEFFNVLRVRKFSSSSCDEEERGTWKVFKRAHITWQIVMILFSCFEFFSHLTVGGECDDFKRTANSSGFSLVDFHRADEWTSDEMMQFDPIIQTNLEEIEDGEFKRARTMRVLLLIRSTFPSVTRLNEWELPLPMGVKDYCLSS